MDRKFESTEKYSDIINLSHHVSKVHPQMSMWDRAAQFSPFAALCGYEEAISESARLTDTKAELDENVKAELDEKLAKLNGMLKDRPKVAVTYYLRDTVKDGGEYIKISGKLKNIDFADKCLIFEDDNRYYIDNIFDIQALDEFF